MTRKLAVPNRWTCESCGTAFARVRGGARRIRFCCQECYHAWNRINGSGGGRFISGHKSWNTGLKGIHNSPSTEFIAGHQNVWNKMPLDSETTRKDMNGKYRVFRKISEPNQWDLRAVVVWEASNGKTPTGHVIHHKDRDSLNDAIGNLQAMTRAEHLAEHRDEIRANFYETDNRLFVVDDSQGSLL